MFSVVVELRREYVMVYRDHKSNDPAAEPSGQGLPDKGHRVFSVLNVDSLEAVHSSHISDGETENNLMARNCVAWKISDLRARTRMKKLCTERVEALLSFDRASHQPRRYSGP